MGLGTLQSEIRHMGMGGGGREVGAACLQRLLGARRSFLMAGLASTGQEMLRGRAQSLRLD